MENFSEQGKGKMIKGNDNRKNEVREHENRRLQKLLQKVVNSEKAPETLRDRISKMIRE